MSQGIRDELLPALLARKEGHVHCVGVCGIGMAGIAVLLRAAGFRVTGCDVALNALAVWLQARGVDVVAGHDPAHVAEDVNWIVRSAAVSADNPEIQAATGRVIPVFRRGEVLPALLTGYPVTIAVGGTHGKTTTTTFITQLLRYAGLNPAYCIGGQSASFDGVASPGGGHIMVVEADESDGTIALYAPEIAVVTNIEFDHMEHFADIEEFEGCFLRLLRQTRRRVIYCREDPRVTRLAVECDKALSYGITEESEVRAARIKLMAGETHYRLFRGPTELGEVRLAAPGRHNVLNSLAAAAVALELGVEVETVLKGCAAMDLPLRRTERIVTRPEVCVISDYAHHPSEIAALVQTARHMGRKRIRAVFQPHRYTRTKALGPDFPAAFEGVDEVILTPVYAASEAPLAGGTVWDLYQHFRQVAPCHTLVATALAPVWEYWKATLREGDLLLVVGAGDVEQIARRAREDIARQPQAALDPVGLLQRGFERIDLTSTIFQARAAMTGRTTLHVGGPADLRADIGSEDDLQNILRWCAETNTPFHLLGAGSNLLLSDLGVRGVVGRLAGLDFRRVKWCDGVLAAGAGLTVTSLLCWTLKHARAGLEFLEGIPGTLGGALCMNAGAWGDQIADRVRWVRGLQRNGTPVRLEQEALDFRYRGCPALKDMIVLEAGLALDDGEPGAMKRQREEFRTRRAWFKGLRCAGSIFKNPPGDHAGRLIEAAELKGLRVGGATIAEQHANVIVVDKSARASDVLALMHRVRAVVAARFGVDLEPEVVFWE